MNESLALILPRTLIITIITLIFIKIHGINRIIIDISVRGY
ncbi:Region of a membrane-bound protein predicted to be embedded in the membrane [Methanobacterium congolense]|uniref:Region of a membrane-bound protein predicted to be embedded in the membrane n=1 Tax=Methanobacterium congolense TaxID=118062 RepID=A0A1D3L0Q8_9EURY|nr:Region of a membrane-bound protein predicted to be embedded in the membrane [Methanobacterium congolense]